MKSIYLIGSLRNEGVPKAAAALRMEGYDVFDDWFAAGPEADDYWQKYEIARGHNYQQALDGYAARHVYAFDKFHLDRCDYGVLLLPAGKSGHLELGYMIGRGKPCFILLAGQPERYDVMYQFATKVVATTEELISAIDETRSVNQQPNPEQCQRNEVRATPQYNPLRGMYNLGRAECGSKFIAGPIGLVDAPQTRPGEWVEYRAKRNWWGGER
jgi:hypothetical protein